MLGIENDETATRADKSPNFPRKILLTDRQVANLCNAFCKYFISQYKIINNSCIWSSTEDFFADFSLLKYWHWTIILIISNKDVENIMKTVNSFESLGFLLNNITNYVE